MPSAGDITIKFYDEYLTGVSDGSYSLGSLASQLNNLYITGLAYIDGFGESTLITNTYEMQFRATTQRIWSSASNILDFDAGTTLDFLVGTALQFALTDGVITPNADNDLDIGTSAIALKNEYVHNLYLQSSINVVSYEEDAVCADGDLVFISS